ncbi:TetR/AcrR family transcriptional regulator [Nocardioides sp. SYSU DS0651]|uniref:TetR/AcrR family transcriptional regulator n=1 Tax=Nocardioides sp. SYSU DS0651 TaxID=3415955 RepID=UPI003F4B8F80
MTTATGTTDGRRLRGDATRRKVAREAAMVATVRGLDSISVGGLAEATGISKSGILTVFGNREAIQVAAVAEARRIYQEHVIGPAWDVTPGRERLTAILQAWRGYLHSAVFPGGCFLASTSVEYGHREGPVADAVRRLKREWLDLLEADLRAAGAPDPVDDAFRIDAYLDAGNARFQLYGDRADLERGCRLALAVVGGR